MSTKLRITLALTLGLMLVYGTLLAMESSKDDKLSQMLAPFMVQATPEPYLVKDIYAGITGSVPSQLTNVDDTLFFVATDGKLSGYGSPIPELWKSNGTADGTVLVKEITTSWSVANLVNVSGTLFFIAGGLWKSDGTPTGTVMLQSFYPPPHTLSELTNVSGTLFFWADDGSRIELWKSDGTPTGTVMVKDFCSAAVTSYRLTDVHGTLFFIAHDCSSLGLWKSDGTPTGTRMVKDIEPSWLINVAGTLFFGSGMQLWTSDGTLTGTVMLKDIFSEWAGGLPFSRVSMNGTLYFVANDGSHGRELWKSDGTPTGTVMVQDIWPGSNSAFSAPPGLTNADGMLFLGANDGTNGVELWKSDGTPTGTVMVKDINPGSASSYPANWIANVNNKVFFRALDGSNDVELWESDGTPAGTVMVKDIYTGTCGERPCRGNPDYFTNANGVLFFRADDGSHGQELWALVVVERHIIYLPVVLRN